MTDVHMTADALATLVLRVHQAAREETAVPAVLAATDLPSPPATCEELRPGDAEFDRAHAALLAEVRAAKAEADVLRAEVAPLREELDELDAHRADLAAERKKTATLEAMRVELVRELEELKADRDRLSEQVTRQESALSAMAEADAEARADLRRELEAVKADRDRQVVGVGDKSERLGRAARRLTEAVGCQPLSLEHAVDAACHVIRRSREVTADAISAMTVHARVEALCESVDADHSAGAGKMVDDSAAEVVHPESRAQSVDGAPVDYPADAAVEVVHPAGRPEWLELVASGVEAGVSFRELLATDEVLDAIEAAAPFELEIMDLYEALGLVGQTAPHVFGTFRAGLRRRRMFVTKARDKVWEVGHDDQRDGSGDVVEPAPSTVAETVTPPLAAAVAAAGGELTQRLDAWAAVLGRRADSSLIPALREAAREAGLIAQRTAEGLYTVRVARTGEAAA